MTAHLTEIAGTGIMLVMLAVAVITDVRAGRIYNWLTAPGAALGLTLGLLAGAGAALGASLLLSSFLPLGGGDVKLLIAVGALKGFHFGVWAMLLTGVFGGALALGVMLRRRAVKQTALNLIANMLSNAGGLRTDLAEGSPAGRIPYSIAIALGSAAALALGG
jgi:prepilin peptidase CpaA